MGNDSVRGKNIFTRFLPFYGWMSVIIMLAINMLAFQATRLVNGSWHHYDFSLPIDDYFPLIKEFIIIYIPIAYGQWIYGFYLAARERKACCYRIFTAEIIAKLICMACFLIIPTTMVRHDVTATDFLSRWVQSVYNTDPADNLFPSIHCLESYILTRAAFSRKIGMERCPAWFKWASVPVTALVFASTLFLRQHVFVDVIAAVVVVEIGLFIACKVVKE
ncbi:hypothetical protein SAMN02910456_01848 [Ruminococcaceae bacterium YRB3002]|nr:hypothetical protein SAMN02910456_01848 [Ruminococcaceae bacterium YRB3002]